MQTFKRIKLIFGIATLILAIICTMSVNAFAATRPESSVTPLWDSIQRVSIDIGFYDNEGSAVATARKQSTSELIEGTLYLYELVDEEWEYIDELYLSKEVGTLAFSIDFTCVEGVTYKAVLTVTAYTNGVGETETFEHIETC